MFFEIIPKDWKTDFGIVWNSPDLFRLHFNPKYRQGIYNLTDSIKKKKKFV